MLHLSTKSSSIVTMHPASWGLLAADGFIATTIYAREALLAYVIFS
jgi:hypothetical protein